MATTCSRRKRSNSNECENILFKERFVRKSIFGEIDKTKEYAIYWFCSNITSPLDRYNISKIKLRGIVDYLRTISSIDEIRQTTDKNICLIMDSTSLDKHINHLAVIEEVRSIYVYENPGNNNQEDNSRNDSPVEYTKVHGRFKDLNELFYALSKTIRTMIYQPSVAIQLPPLTSTSKTVERSTSATYSYVTDWYIHLIRSLQEVPPTRTCKEKFVEECNILYQDNPSVLNSIKEFNETYTSEDAIRWYTRDGFVYKVLNRVLREQNQQKIQLLHFFIYDLDRQLKNELRTKQQDWMKADTVRLYRGQLMSLSELEQLKKNKGEELFINSFLSTTLDHTVATIFSGAGAFDSDGPIQAVIFQIEWADNFPKQGIADIHHLSFNGDEGEILLSPTHTVNLLDCVYDEKERVWNATFTRLCQTDNPLIRISIDERLMRLELSLRHLIEQKDPSTDDMEDDFDTNFDFDEKKVEFTKKFCRTFFNDVQILLDELELPALCSVTLNNDDSGRFELKALRCFTVEAFDHGPTIDDKMVVTLYDALGTVFKIKGKFMEAYYYYQKASLYDEPQSQTSYTRQSYLAQIHKMQGDFKLASNIFDELMDQTRDTDVFLYEDIAFARSNNMSDEDFLENSRAFLNYCSRTSYDHDDVDDDEEQDIDEGITYVISAWAELGYKYFYQNQNTQQALICYEQEKDLSLAFQSRSSYFNPLMGSCSERMGDVYASMNDFEKALRLYKEALTLSMEKTLVTYEMVTARCKCKIGYCSPVHEPDIFHEAFQHLIHGYGKLYGRDIIGKCYVYLARSLERCKRYEQAIKYAKQALSIFLHDPLLLERLTDNCCLLIIELYRSVNDAYNTIPSKEELLNNKVSLNDEQIKTMLSTTIEELNSELNNKKDSQ